MTPFWVKTLGCKVNQCDTQSLREGLARLGCRPVSRPQDARLLVVNTCCVTHHADRKSRQAVRHAARLKGEGCRLAVVGCYPGYARGVLQGIPGVDAVFTHEERAGFWEWVGPFCDPVGPVPLTDGRFSGRTRAFLKVQEGCDNRCSYCVVPLVRGPSKSVSMDEAVSSARRLVAAGHKEIVLTGVNLGAFRAGGCGEGLIRLIDALEGLPGLARIRLSSIEAPDVTDALIDRMAGSRKLCPHLHVPFQSGDDGVLEHMGKRLRAVDYLDLVTRVRRRLPAAAITCDVIVGYPVETPSAFENTCRFLREVEPLKTHLFTFSPRRGTRLETAATRPLAPRLVRDRRIQLEGLTHELAQSYKRRFLGERAEVLVEAEKGGRWWGHTANYIRVGFCSSSCQSGSILPVLIDGLDGEGLSGRMCNQQQEFLLKKN